MKTREELRELGQFWTPDWVAENMVRYSLGGGADHLFDPSHGMGAFFVAAKKLNKELDKKVKFFGTDIDPNLVQEIKNQGLLTEKELQHLEVEDFIKIALNKKYKAIAANPPYIRHHRIPAEAKLELKQLGKKYLGKELDGRAGLHIYFLILSLLALEKNGRLSFIVSADICEGVFSSTLWKWVAENYRIDAVLTFSGDATPFPNVDTNPVVFFIQNASPTKKLSWARCVERDTDQIHKWIKNAFSSKGIDAKKLKVVERQLVEAINTGLTRQPQTEVHKFTLADFAYTMRGIATGNNNFFLLDKRTAREFKIPSSYLVPAIGRTRDVTGDVINDMTLAALEKKGRPHFLLYINTDKLSDLPQSVRNYIAHGESEGVHRTPLIAARRTWYKMERRDPPPILFSYLGRRSSRFILNEAKVLPLNGFLCIYPKDTSSAGVNKLLKLINHKEVLNNLFLVGKSYGSDAVKVEPRAIERLGLPEYLVREVGLSK